MLNIPVIFTRATGASGPVSVAWATSSGTAIGGASCTGTTDFITGSGTIDNTNVNYSDTGSFTAYVPVTVCGDTTVELDETLTLTLSSPTASTISTGTSTGTIKNDDAPTITLISPTSGPIAGGTTVTLTGTGFITGETVVFGLYTGTSITIVNSTTITVHSPAVPSAGTVDINVVAGSTASASGPADQFTYLPVPAVTSINPTQGPTTAGTPVTINGTGFTGATSVKFGANSATGVLVVNDSQITANAPSGVVGTVDVTVTTPGGTSATSANDKYTYLAVPTVTSVSPAAGPPAGGSSVTITGTNFSGITAVTFGLSNPATTYTVNSTTQITATSPAGTLGQVDVQVANALGTSTANSGDLFTYSNGPTVTGVSPTAGPITAGTSVTVTGTDFVTGMSVSFGGTAGTSVVVGSPTSLTVLAPAHAAGTVDVTVTTGAGTSGTSAADQYTFAAVPTVTAVSPNSGPLAGGTSVTITGTGFMGTGFTTSAVTFAGVAATNVIVVNSTTITATTPAGTAGTAAVRVTTPGGQSTTNTFWTYRAAPTISSMSASAGPLAGGTIFTITGTNFVSGATSVTFGAVSGTVNSVTGTTSMSVTSPAQLAGTVDVTVTTTGGTSAIVTADKFTYTPAPTVTGVSPSAGPTTSGTTVTLTGTNFVSGATVSFGGTAGTGVVFNSATSITVTAPTHAAGTVDVTVTTAGGTSVANPPGDQYTFTAAPTVLGVSPAFDSIAGGSTVVITGTNFLNASAVAFGGTAAASYSVDSATQITAMDPAGAAGQVDIRITTVGGTSAVVTADHFTYYGLPTVTARNPTAGPLGGGTTVTLTGTGFAGVTAVDFGLTAAGSFTVNSPTSITVPSPAESAGPVDITVVAVGGTSATSANDVFTYTPAPSVTGLNPTAGPTGAGGPTVTITGTNFVSGATVSFGGTAGTSVVVVTSTSITVVPPAHAAGTVDVTVNTAGGTSATSPADQYTFTALPTVTLVSPNLDVIAGGATVVITGTGFSGASAVTFGGSAATSYTVNSATQITATDPAHAAGTVDVQVTTIGGTSSAVTADHFTYYDTPTVTGRNPIAGPTTGGTTVTLTGTNFAPGATVMFGSNPGTGVVVNSSTSLTVVSPAGSVGPVDIVVTAIGGTSATSANDVFTYVLAPTVTAISPTSGSFAGGTAVTITGTNFVSGATVNFGATAGTNVVVVNSTTITVTAPAHANGTVDITVTTAAGTSAVNAPADQFTYSGTAYNWVGGTSTAWATASNWSPAVVPGVNDTATIGNFVPGNQPTLSASTTVAGVTITGRSATTSTRGGCLTIPTGVTLTISGNLAITGSSGGGSGITCGTGTTDGILATGTGSVTVGGNVTLTNSTGGPPENPIITLATGTLTIGGNFTEGSSATFAAGTGTVTFNGTSPQTIDGSAVTFYNLIVNKSAGTATLGVSETVGSNLTVSAGTLDLSTFTANRSSGGGTLSVAAGAGLRIGGTNPFPANFSTVTLASTSTVEYYGTGQTVTNESYGNLTLSGSSGAKTLGTAVGITGNFSNNLTGTATLAVGTGTVTFNGSAGQTIDGSTASTFYNLVISNAAGVSLSGVNTTVSNTLTLTSGTVTTGSQTLIANGTVSRGTGYVIGNLQKPYTSTAAKDFEVGTASGYSPVTGLAFSSFTGSGTVIVSAVAATEPNLATSGISNTKYVQRYWTITESGGTPGTIAATFNFLAGDIQNGANYANFIVQRDAAGTWTSPTTGTQLAYSTAASGIASAGTFNIAIGETGTVSTTTSAAAAGATYGDASVNLSATVTPASGTVNSGTVTFTIKNGAITVGSVTSGTVTGNSATANFPLTASINAGTYTIDAAYSGAPGILASDNTLQPPPALTVSQLPITVTAVTDTKPYDGTTSSAGVPTITTGSLAFGQSATWTQTFDTKDVGTGKTLTPAGSVADGNGGNNYAVTFVPDTTGVINGVGSITTVVVSNATYDGNPHGGSASWISSGADLEGGSLPVTYTGTGATTYGPSTAAPTDAGTYSAYASFAGDANHSGSSDLEYFTISTKLVTVVTSDASKSYGDADPNPLTSADLSGFVAADNISATFSRDPGEGVGTYHITTTLVDPDNRLANYTVTNTGATFTINGVGSITTVVVSNATYDGNPHGGSASWISSGADLEGGSLPVTYTGTGATTYGPSTAAPTDAGTYSAYASFAGDANHSGSSDLEYFTISTKLVTVVTSDASKSYGDADPNPLTSADLSGFVAADNISATFSRDPGEGVGTYHITTTLVDPDNRLANYTVTNTGATFTINGVGSITTVVVSNATYDGNPHGGSASWISSGADLEGGSLPVTYTGTGATTYGPSTAAPTDAGTYSAYASFAGDANHSGSSDLEYFTISTKLVTVVTSDASKSYGDADPNPLTSADLSGFVAADNISATFSRDPGEGVGTYHITTTLVDPDNRLANYTVTNTGATFTINGVGSITTVVVSNATYDGNPHGGSASWISSGADLEGGSLPVTYTGTGATTYGPSTAAPTDAGTYSAYASFAGDANHSGSSDLEYFTISTKLVTVVTSDASKSYGDADPNPLTSADLSGFVAADNISATFSRDPGEGVGTYHITTTLVDPDNRLANYTVTNTGATFTINGVGSITTVVVSNATYDGNPHGGSASWISSGADLEGGSLPVTYTGTGATTYGPSTAAPTDAGTYSAYASFAGDANHSGSSDLEYFTINGVGSITTVVVSNATYDGNPHGGSASWISSGADLEGGSLPVTYTGTGATTYGPSTAAPTDAGTYSAYASFAGDANHSGSSDLEYFTINGVGSITTVVVSNATYDGNPHGGSASWISSGADLEGGSLPVTYTGTGATTYGPSTAAPTDAGTYSAYASFAGDANHSGSSDLEYFTISTKLVTVVTSDASKSYGDADPNPLTSADLSGFVAADNISATFSRDPGEGVGTYHITTTLVDPDNRLANYTVTNTGATFTINGVGSITTVVVSNATYDGNPHGGSASWISSGADLEGGSLPVTYTGTGATTYGPSTAAPTDAGTYSAYASFAGDANHSGSSDLEYFTISTRAITVTAATNSKTYDGTTSAAAIPSITVGALQGTDAATLSETYDTANVGTGKTLTPAIVFTVGSASNYAITLATNTTGVISTRAITVTAATNSKTYDGTTSAAAIPSITVGALQGTDAATLSETYDTANVGTGKTLTPAIVFTVGSASNYAITLATNTTGVISTRAITVTAATNSKTYDGTTSAAAIPSITVGALQGTDAATLSETYDTANVGTGKTLTPAIVFTVGSASNYAITLATNTTGVISTRAITVTAATNSKTYDGTTSAAAIPSITVGALQGTDAATLSETYDTANVGTGKTLTPAIVFTVGSASNYAITLATNTTGVISTRAITVTAATNSKTYDGTTSAAAIPSITVGALQGTDAATLSETYDTANVGTGKTLTPAIVFTVGSASNYAITLATNTTGVISTRAITVTAATNSKTYDGTTSAAAIPSITVGALQGTDAATLSETYDTANVGTGKTLTPAIVFTVGSASNYAITLATNTTGVISTRAITVTAATNSKTYDGTTSAAAIPSITVGALQGTDAATLSETYDTANVGTGKTLTPAIVFTVGSASNYAITLATNTTGVISTRAITVTAATNSKTYDGTTSAAAIPSITVGALQGTDAATLSETYDTANVGTGKTLTPAIVFTVGSASNYAITLATNTTGVISTRAITVTAATNSKTYDGTTSAAAIPSITVGALQGTDAATLSETYDTANVGTGKTLTPAIVFTVGSASNYAITLATNTTGVISTRAITVTAATNSKTYDGTTSAAAIPSITVGALQGTDAATLSETYDTANVGTGKTLTPAIVFTVGSASNYAITLATNTTGVISTRAITVTAATNSKTYDGTTSAAAIPSITVGALQGTDAATLSETYDTANVGTGKTLTPAIVFTVGSASNYAITLATNTTGVISTRAITVTAATNSKTYDGTTSAAAIPSITVGALQGTDAATLSETYDTANVGTGKTLTPAIVFTVGSASNYAITLATNTTGVISTRAITVTAATNSKTYDGTTSAAAIPSITVGALQGTDAATLSETYDTANVGTGKTLTPAIVFTVGSASNYAITLATNTTGVISTKGLTVTATVGQSKVYGAAMPTLAYTYATLVNGDTSSVFSGALATTATASSSVGSYPITQGTLTAGANYTITFVGTTFAVTPKAASVTPNAATKVYGAADPALTGTLVGFLAADSVTATFSRTAGSTVAGSPYTISATLSPSGVLGNYTITYNTANFTITPKAASVTPNSASKVYGAADPAFSGTLVGFLAADNVTATYTRTAGQTVAGSPYTISATLAPAGVLSNYSITYGTGSFTITKAPLTVTATVGQSKVYGAAMPTLAYTYATLVNGDTASVFSGALASTATASSSVGSYPITQGTLSAGANYAITFVGTTFAVTPAPLTVTATVGQSKVYGAAMPTLAYTYATLVNGDTSSVFSGALATTATASSSVGSYPITQGTLSAGANYTITFVGTTFAVTPKAASVTPNAATKVAGTADPVFTGTLTGFVASDNVTATYSRTAGETAGTYTISATLSPTAVLGNYTITYNTAKLTITPGPVSYLVLAPATPTINQGASQAFTATGYDVENDNLGDVTSATTFTIAGGGSCTGASCTSTVVGNHTVTGTDGTATGTATLHVNSVIGGGTGTSFYAISPRRILDTRPTVSGGNPTNIGLSGKFTAGTVRKFAVAGAVYVGGGTAAAIPATAIAVTGNLTVVNETAAGVIDLGPATTATGTTSSLNFVTGDTRANNVTLALATDGSLSAVYRSSTSGATTDLIFDLTGYFLPGTSGATYHTVTPGRVLDTRATNSGIGSVHIGPLTTLANRVVGTFPVTGVIPVGGTTALVPSTAVAVTGNLTVTNASSVGYAALGPTMTTSPSTSTVNVAAGTNVANGVTVALSSGKLQVVWCGTTGSTADVIFDVTGYFTAGAGGLSFYGIAPTRVLDSSKSLGLSGSFASKTARLFTVPGVPTGTGAIAGNLTVITPSSAGWGLITPEIVTSPTTSTLNAPSGQSIANGFDVALGASGHVAIEWGGTTGSTANFSLDLTGYWK